MKQNKFNILWKKHIESLQQNIDSIHEDTGSSQKLIDAINHAEENGQCLVLTDWENFYD